MTFEQKKPYNEPCLTVLRTATMQMLAASGDPIIRTTSEKVDASGEALSKENKSYDVWDDDWSE